jgi:hypothetical protein
MSTNSEPLTLICDSRPWPQSFRGCLYCKAGPNMITWTVGNFTRQTEFLLPLPFWWDWVRCAVARGPERRRGSWPLSLVTDSDSTSLDSSSVVYGNVPTLRSVRTRLLGLSGRGKRGPGRESVSADTSTKVAALTVLTGP